MILNGKCKEDFIKWYDKNYISVERFLKDFDPEQLFNTLHESFKPTLINDFFDSVGMHIKTYPHLRDGQVVFCSSFCYLDERHIDNEINSTFYNGKLFYSLTRLEATNEIIKKANLIYNSR